MKMSDTSRVSFFLCQVCLKFVCYTLNIFVLRLLRTDNAKTISAAKRIIKLWNAFYLYHWDYQISYLPCFLSVCADTVENCDVLNSTISICDNAEHAKQICREFCLLCAVGWYRKFTTMVFPFWLVYFSSA